MKPIELYLHIGMGKTGTSAIQKFLAENTNTLQKLGILYPLAHRSEEAGGAHHALAIVMMKNQPAWSPVTAPVSPEQILMDMRREALALGLDKILVSSEILYVIPPRALRDLVGGFRSTIILYVRRQDLHVMSMMNQAIKAQGVYCDSATVSFDPGSWDTLLRFVAGWMDVFPKEDVIIRPYERQQFVSKNLVADFLSVLDVPVPCESFEKNELTNQSLSRDALEYMNQVNALVSDPSFTGRIGDLLVGFAEQESDHPEQNHSLLSPHERLTMIERYAELNSRIAREYLSRAGGQLFYDPLPSLHDDWKPYPGLSRERAMAITAYLQQRESMLVDELAARLGNPSNQAPTAAREASKVLVPAVQEIGRWTATRPISG